jgi:hypothetical protein
MFSVDRRALFVAGLAAPLISNVAEAAESSPEARLRELGIELPKVAAPVANYVPSTRLATTNNNADIRSPSRACTH